jgi:hypothetical protein
MIDRRSLMAGGVGLAGGVALRPHQAFADKPTTYDDAVRSTWAPLRADGGPRELVRYATLAANSHNTQPWTFRISEDSITVKPDFGRRCQAVDPDDHHLFVSLGCAAENLVHAAAAAGLKASPALIENVVSIRLEPAPAKRSPLLEAIPIRQSTRAVYDGKPVANETLRLLEQAGTGDGVAVTIMTDQAKIASVTDFVIEGNSAQMRDPAFMNELKGWIRFNEADALATMDGLYSRASGNPSLPRWLSGILLRLVFTERSENDKYRAQIMSFVRSRGLCLGARRQVSLGWSGPGLPALRPAGDRTRAEMRLHQSAGRGGRDTRTIRGLSRYRRPSSRPRDAVRVRPRIAAVAPPSGPGRSQLGIRLQALWSFHEPAYWALS